MDNVTHTLAGLVLADALLAARSRRGATPLSRRWQRGVAWSSALASNGPDLDLFLVGITEGKLGYLLHHRGHTHTLVAAPLIGALLSLLAWAAVAGARGSTDPRAGRGEGLRWMLTAGLTASLLHLSMDLANNYGVHPLWPIYDGWFYGDVLFIVEPWLILVLLGGALPFAASRVGRALLWGVAAVLLGLVWSNGNLVPSALAALLTGAGVSWLAWLRRAPRRRRLTAVAVASGALLAAFGAGGARARADVRRALEEAPGKGRLLDIASTPSPGNPLCWTIVAMRRASGVEPAPGAARGGGEQYEAYGALASALPSLAAADHCTSFGGVPTAERRRLSRRSAVVAAAPQIRWGFLVQRDLARLSERLREDCEARAFLRFARAPFWQPGETDAWLFGDLRFDREPGLGFTELLTRRERPCPDWLPPWKPPRADLLEPNSSPN